ncbi:flavin-containing monooxygenase [Novosphingobium sp. BL-52-GroH]|uniref:flavin-containing monooxygenase n=1 Tax=Novosphingobium sp. BL-52-GroH TaxID=3349877 RepID=UPI00384C9EE3
MNTEYQVVILGAGLGGIGLGAVLRSQGIDDFLIVEKEDGPGGTWRDNIYPGAACDTESHLYCFSFDLHKEVSRLYARQPELLRYAERLVERQGLAPHIAYGREIVSARWDADALRWTIALADGQSVRARIFVAAWGQLNRPQIPEIAGRETFAGQQFHSARWPRDLDLADKRVASVGNAASAIQYIPAIAPEAGHLTVFQRSPNWIVPRGDRPYTPEELARFIEHPTAFDENKAELFAWRETTFLRMREGSEEAREVEQQARDHLVAQVGDPALRARLLPDFPLGCKRVLRSDDYYPALCRDNVSLVTEAIDRIVPEGIVTSDGVLHEMDVIIWGTGFETQSFQGPVDVHGSAGASLRDEWQDGARAYKGMAVAGFPNFFLIYGPNTNLGHNSVLSMFEAQFAYIAQAAAVVLEQDVALEVGRDSMERYDAALQAEMDGSAWAGNCTSWYKNAAGRVVNNWSGPVQDYQALTRRFDREAYRELTEAR